MDNNIHIRTYLQHYIQSTTAPRFAVLLSGPWGVGKTHLVRDLTKPFAEKGTRFAFVSLYGVESFEEIDDALFRAVYPALDNKALQVAGRVVKAIAKHFSVDPDVSTKDVLSRANADVFVFDDLERCSLPIERALAYINEFVEHEERKVVIVANEQEIKNTEEYRRIREKVIGKTLKMRSVFGEALQRFVLDLEDVATKKFLATKTEDISVVYNNFGLANLRILQQTIWDFSRLFTVLNDKHRSHGPAMTALVQLFFALSFEQKAGRLTADDLRQRQSTLIVSLMRKSREEGVRPPIATAQERYPTVDLGSTILSDETLLDAIEHGVVEADKAIRELDASSFFVTVADEPAWRTVWHAFDRTEEEFNIALAALERSFFSRDFTAIGEILHVFGLRLWLSDIGALPASKTEVSGECKEYVEDLYRAGRLEPAQRPDALQNVRFDGYGGLAIHQVGTQEYSELYAYLADKRRAAAVDRYPAVARDLLSIMKSDPDLFRRRISLTNDSDNLYYNIPILCVIGVNQFVEELLALHPEVQRTILYALDARYRFGHLDKELKDERAWAMKVRNALYEWAGGLSPISKYRIRQTLNHTLDEVLLLGNHAPASTALVAGGTESTSVETG